MCILFIYYVKKPMFNTKMYMLNWAIFFLILCYSFPDRTFKFTSVTDSALNM